MSAGDFRRHTFVVVEQGDGSYLAYEEDKGGPAPKIEKVECAREQEPYKAIAQLCSILSHVVT